MHNLKKKLLAELETFDRDGGLSVGEVDLIQKLTSTIKNICKIEMFEEEDGHSERRGYSRDGDWMARGSYDDDSSSRRKRDAMGRYSRDGYDERRSYADGKDRMIERIEEMMHETASHKEREALKKCLEEFRNA